jgi:hypothetical protein
MAHPNSVKLHETSMFSFKPLFAIRDFFNMISSAWAEAKMMEQKSHKNSANW